MAAIIAQKCFRPFLYRDEDLDPMTVWNKAQNVSTNESQNEMSLQKFKYVSIRVEVFSLMGEGVKKFTHGVSGVGQMIT